MSITLVAVVIALALGHVAPALVTAARQYHWYGHWLRWLERSARRRDGHAGESNFWRGRYGIAIALLPPLLLVRCCNGRCVRRCCYWVSSDCCSRSPHWSTPGGPRDLDLDVDAMIDAHDPIDAPRRHRACTRRRCRFRRDGPAWSKRYSAARCGAGSACCSGSCCWGRSARLLYRLTHFVEGEFAREPAGRNPGRRARSCTPCWTGRWPN